MKRFGLFSLVFTMLCVVATSCVERPETVDTSHDAEYTELIVGRWRTTDGVAEPTASKPYLYYVYLADGTGYTWDASEDINEDEAQAYTWSIYNAEVTQTHKKELGSSVVPKRYKIRLLNSSKMVYEDQTVSKTYTFTRL